MRLSENQLKSCHNLPHPPCSQPLILISLFFSMALWSFSHTRYDLLIYSVYCLPLCWIVSSTSVGIFVLFTDVTSHLEKCLSHSRCSLEMLCNESHGPDENIEALYHGYFFYLHLWERLWVGHEHQSSNRTAGELSSRLSPSFRNDRAIYLL